jgi:competence ComEA-like helix-hairpin-helix protein
MTRRASQRTSLGWGREDCIALVALLAFWGAWLLWTAFVRRGSDRPSAVYPEKVRMVRERIDPNTAEVASLRRLPLIGPERANAIVEYRQGPVRAGRAAFEFLEDLQNVPGIGPGTIGRARDLICLPPRQTDRPGAQQRSPASRP